MQQRFQFIPIDSILSKFLRDFKGLDISEDDAIEWAGEALGFMQYTSMTKEQVAFIEVKNYQANIPEGLKYIIQIARDNSYVSSEHAETTCTPKAIVESIVDESEHETNCGCGCDGTKLTDKLALVDCHGELLGNEEIAYYRPYFDLQYEYLDWAYSKLRKNRFSTVRLANNSFFNSLVCSNVRGDSPYKEGQSGDEYTISGNQLRFSFKEGAIALAYLKTYTDPETGYPMVPDDESARSAITYYLGWKIKEREAWNHREGALQLAQVAEARWLKYIKQFNNKSKMPWGTDEYQDLMEQGNYLIPRTKRYYGFFGNLGKAEERPFNDPNLTTKYRFLNRSINRI